MLRCVTRIFVAGVGLKQCEDLILQWFAVMAELLRDSTKTFIVFGSKVWQGSLQLLSPSPEVANLFLQTCQNIISDLKQVYTVPVTLNKTN